MSEHISEIPLKYCLYARKSTESDEKQTMSIEAQIREMLEIAQKEKLEVVEIRQESKSAKAVGNRPVYNQLLADIESGLFNGIITWAPDRLSRNAGDLGKIVDLMDAEHLQEIRTHGQTFHNNPNEKFLLMILCSQAKLENDNRGKNIKRGMRAACERGRKPGLPPLGYQIKRDPSRIRGECKIILDDDKAKHIQRLFHLITDEDKSGREAWEITYNEGFRTRSGKKLTLSMIYRIFKDTFYYGEFEYPRESGNWYKGNHKPLITKEQFLEVRKRLATYEKSKWGAKTFYFSRLLKCGNCGSGVCGEEHVRQRKAGPKRYVYYKCTKWGGKQSCKELYINEKNLIDTLVNMVHELKETDLKLDSKIKRQITLLNEMNNQSGIKRKLTPLDYIRQVLTNGNGREKSRILRCLKGQLYLQNGVVYLAENDDIVKNTDARPNKGEESRTATNQIKA